jgi:uncharacterized SAM-dependent methyltransferase
LEETAHVEIDEGEVILMAQSYKYSNAEVMGIFHSGNLQVVREWTNDDRDCSLYLLVKDDCLRGSAAINPFHCQ